jgi:hypothetical protein
VQAAIAAGLLLAAALVAPPAPAAGVAENSFSGRCPQVQGTTHFDPPITNSEGPTNFHFVGSGTCDGVLNGATVAGAALNVDVAGPLEASCLSAHATAPAQVVAAFTQGTPDPADDVVLHLTFTGTGTGPNFEGPVQGQRSGTGRAQGTFATSRTPPDATLACGGPGISDIATDVSITTDTPLVSDVPAPPVPMTDGGREGGLPRLRLSVRPRVVHVGRRTRFRFHVVAGGGRSARGAVVSFAGRRVHVNRAGRGSLAARFGRRGIRHARVTEKGLRAASVAVRVLG